MVGFVIGFVHKFEKCTRVPQYPYGERFVFSHGRTRTEAGR